MAIVVMMAVTNTEMNAGSDAADMGSDANAGIRSHRAK